MHDTEYNILPWGHSGICIIYHRFYERRRHTALPPEDCLLYGNPAGDNSAGTKHFSDLQKKKKKTNDFIHWVKWVIQILFPQRQEQRQPSDDCHTKPISLSHTIRWPIFCSDTQRSRLQKWDDSLSPIDMSCRLKGLAWQRFNCPLYPKCVWSRCTDCIFGISPKCLQNTSSTVPVGEILDFFDCIRWNLPQTFAIVIVRESSLQFTLLLFNIHYT